MCSCSYSTAVKGLKTSSKHHPQQLWPVWSVSFSTCFPGFPGFPAGSGRIFRPWSRAMMSRWRNAGHGASPGGSGADVVGIVAEGRGKIMENLLECGQPNAINIHKPTIGDGWLQSMVILMVYGCLWHWVYHGLPHWNLMHAGCLAIYAWHGLVCIRGAHESLLLLVRKRLLDDRPSHSPTIEVGHVTSQS